MLINVDENSDENIDENIDHIQWYLNLNGLVPS